ncbi:selenoprotein K-like [Vespula pensylvanica]|uniref:selenoprotein K-like n=1 Tax=Vespula pensylvanica TaxID=30213 RepID=UPI001CB9E7A2|nr:selenoprotein K-like [Vespula pensylvanica]
MVYISSDGKIHDSVPWGFKKITNFFSSIIYLIIMFFKTLFGMDINKSDGKSSKDNRPGFGPPKPPGRKLGRLRNIDHNVDVPVGGCSSCLL